MGTRTANLWLAYEIMKRLLLAAALVLFAAATPAPSPRLSPAMRALLDKIGHKIEMWGTDPLLIAAVKEQNAKKTPMQTIHKIDERWMANGEKELASQLLNNAAAKRLQQLIGEQKSIYIETFLMDDQGANVAMTNRTSDYWQGDEAKWQKSFNNGVGALFIDEPAYDESAKAMVVQISVPVMEGKHAIGAITVAINEDVLAKGH